MKNILLFFLIIISIGLNFCTSSKHNPLIPGDYSSGIVDQKVMSRIDSTLNSFVISGQVAGISALIYEKNTEVYFNAFGYADREADTPMTRNTIALIYSMTKPITGAALMTLHEKGAFNLDDPITKYAPEFADMKVYAGVDASGAMILEPLERSITIRDLTRHTAGFVNRTDIPGLGPQFEALDIRNPKNTLTTIAEKLGSIPLWFQPGSQWEYGLCVDIQAFLVEKISGVPFDKYVRDHVLVPLNMFETRYYVPESDRNRLAANYLLSDEGLSRVPDEQAWAFNTQHWPLTPGGFGLTSTLDDYMRFARMLVNKGTLENTTILQPETVKLMATNHLSDSIKIRSWLPSKGQVGFGIDFAVRLRPPETMEENNGVVGEFFWDGAASTLFWVDPVNDLTAVLFVQLFPYDQIGLHKKFRDAVYGKAEITNVNDLSSDSIILGAFHDDYGYEYLINEENWHLKPELKYEIIKWNKQQNFIITSNKDNASATKKYSRIDYVHLKDMEPYLWCYCISAYDKNSAEAAESVQMANPADLKKGCNGFPFSRMKPANDK